MGRIAAMLSVSAAVKLLLSGTGSAQDIEPAERLLGGNENPAIISDGSGRPDRVHPAL
jgi:hypothetical protein